MIADPMTWYLEQIGRWPLLTASQEIELNRRVRRMVELEESGRKLTKAERRELRSGRRAAVQMVNCNLRLVVSVARKYAGQCRHLTVMDLIQEGSASLPTAVRKFDGRMGYKFSTYAYWWIRQGMRRAMNNQERAIRLPVHQEEKIYQAKRLTEDYVKEHGHKPSREWLAEHIGGRSITVEDLYLLDERAQGLFSLDALAVEDGSTLLELIKVDENADSAAVLTEDFSAAESLMEFIEPRDRKMLELRYGIGTGEPKTFDAIAKQFGVSRDCGRHRILAAEKRLRQMAATG